MRSIILASVPIHGHVTPLLGVARYFVSRGDQVRFITGSRFAQSVGATGATHLPLPAGADFDDRQDFNARFPARARLKGARAIAFDIEHVFIRPIQAQYDAVIAACANESADLILTDPAFAGGALLLGHARSERPALAVCGVLPLSLSSIDTAPFGIGLAPAKRLNPLRNALLARLVKPVFKDSQRIADATYRQIHGIALPYPILDWMRHADAIAQFTVPSFEYPRSDAPANLHFVGPLSATGSQAPRPEWWGDLDGGLPIVHVSQGTIANKDYGQLIAPTLAALANERVLVVVSTGGRPLDTLPPLPANARAAQFLPYDELLPRTSVFVTNGGYGGVQYALRYGVPIVAIGGKEDKPEVGARIAWANVGRRIRSERPSASALSRAIRAVLTEPSYREASRRMAAEMAAAPGLSGLTAIADALIERRPSAKPAGASQRPSIHSFAVTAG